MRWRLTKSIIISRRRLVLAALIVFLGAKGFIWAVIVPPFQAPDEYSHLAYAEDIARTGRLISDERTGSKALDRAIELERTKQIAFNTPFPGTIQEDEIRAQRDSVQEIPADDVNAPGTFSSTASSYPPLYYAICALVIKVCTWLGAGILGQVLALRLFGVLLTMLALPLQLKLMERLLGSGPVPMGGAALIALAPMYAHISASINPDVMMITLASAVLLLACNVADGGRRAHWFLLTAALAASLMVKQTGLVLVPAVLVALVWAGWGTSRSLRLRVALKSIAVVVGSVVPVALIAVLSRGGSSPSPAAGIASSGAKLVSLSSLRAYGHLVRELWTSRYVSSFWASFGWMDTKFGPRVYDVFNGLAGLVAVGAAYALFATRRWTAEWVICGTAVVGMAMMLFGIEYTLSTSGTEQAFIQGRYAFPLAAPLVAVALGALTTPLRRVGVSNALVAGLCLAMGIFNIAAMVQLVLPRYSL